MKMLLHISGWIWIIQTSGFGTTYQTFGKSGKINNEPDPSLTLKNKLQIKIMHGKMKYKNREESMGKYVSILKELGHSLGVVGEVQSQKP